MVIYFNQSQDRQKEDLVALSEKINVSEKLNELDRLTVEICAVTGSDDLQKGRVGRDVLLGSLRRAKIGLQLYLDNMDHGTFSFGSPPPAWPYSEDMRFIGMATFLMSAIAFKEVADEYGVQNKKNKERLR